MKKTNLKINKKTEETMPVKEIKRHMTALSEDFQHKLSVIGEQYFDIKKTLGLHTNILNSHSKTLELHTNTLDSNTEMIGGIMEDIEIIKSNIEIVKAGVKKKVDDDEFTALERRLSILENKVRV